MLLFVPLARWRHLEQTFLLKEPFPTDTLKAKRFTDILLDGLQLNGLVSVFVCEDILILKHISPFMKPLMFERKRMIKTDRKKMKFDVWEIPVDGASIYIGLRKGILD